MMDLIKEIEQVDGMEIDRVLQAILRRYAELFPDWEVSTISLEKASDRNEQLDRIMAVLQDLKKPS